MLDSFSCLHQCYNTYLFSLAPPHNTTTALCSFFVFVLFQVLIHIQSIYYVVFISLPYNQSQPMPSFNMGGWEKIVLIVINNLNNHISYNDEKKCNAHKNYRLMLLLINEYLQYEIGKDRNFIFQIVPVI